MRYVVAILAVLFASSASAQDIFFEDSYSTPDYGYGYSTMTYGFGGRLGAPLQPYWIDTYTSPDYGYGRHSSSYGFSSGYTPIYDYGYSPSRYSFLTTPRRRFIR